MPTNLQRIEQDLAELMRFLPAARIVGAMDDWSRLYTEGYMLKMRVWK